MNLYGICECDVQFVVMFILMGVCLGVWWEEVVDCLKSLFFIVDKLQFFGVDMIVFFLFKIKYLFGDS